ncbi:MAG: epoxyqueuosine reductase QueH [bacterium]
MEQLLLHTCCGPDLTYAFEFFSRNYRVTGYFANDNIDSAMEYDKRFEQAAVVADEYGFEIIKKKYEPHKFEEVSRGLEEEPEQGIRCAECHRMNFRSAVEFAKIMKIDNISTTLTISPHKNVGMINRVGSEVASESGISFIGENLRKNDGFKKSLLLSKKLNLYRQSWCGCKFSRGKLG